MKETWLGVGVDYVLLDTYGSITGIIKPVRNQVTGEVQSSLTGAYTRYKPPDRKGNKTA